MKSWTQIELDDWAQIVSDGSDITITSDAMQRFVKQCKRTIKLEKILKEGQRVYGRLGSRR